MELLIYKSLTFLVFFAFFGLEHIKPAVKTASHGLRRIAKNLSFWPLNIFLSLMFIFPITKFTAGYALFERPEYLQGAQGLLLDIVILDIFIYFWHRAMHEVPFLWRFHQVHHLDEHLDTTSAVRFHFAEIFFATFVRACVVFLFALPFSSIVMFESLVLMAAFFHHSNIKLPKRLEGILSKIIITPSIHWVHHHAIRSDTDSNYGTIFSFWDKIFQTRSKTLRTTTMKIGVEGMKDKPFLRLLVLPIL